jgi:hypothetical protein
MRGIQFRRGVYLIIGVMLVLATSACSSSDSEEIYGVWVLGGSEGVHFTFNEDGSWSVIHPDATPDRPEGWGTFTFDDGLLTLTQDPAVHECGGTVGTYQAEFTTEGNLALNNIEDPCAKASRQLRGIAVRYSP